MKTFFERTAGWLVAGVFVFGGYAFAHYMLRVDDQTMLMFVGALIWQDLAIGINKVEAEA